MLSEADIKTAIGREDVEVALLLDGGQKQVFKSKIDSLPHAIKCIDLGSKRGSTSPFDEVALKRAIREVGLYKVLKSPYLPKLGSVAPTYFFKKGHVYYIFSEEYITGYDLGELLTKGIDDEMTQQMLQQILAAIKECWKKKKLVHRDLSLRNIRYNSKASKFVLLDLGLGLVLSESSITPPHMIAGGTIKYMSPERITDRRNLDIRSDFYSLSVIAYECITGKHPYCKTGMSRSEIFEAILSTKPEPIEMSHTSLPEKLIHSIEKNLEKRPHRRIRTCEEFINRVK